MAENRPEEGETPHARYARSLTSEERLLITLRDELYNRSWQRMLQDLEDRLEGKPYVFKLADRIEEDLERIRKLKEYEETHSVNLSDLLEAEES